MKTSKELQVSINALSIIKNSAAPISTEMLATQVGTTAGFLGQIMKKLRKSELVHAKHGPGGGYVFNRQRFEVTAFDVATALGYEFGEFGSSGSEVLGERLDGQIIDVFLRTKI